MFDAYTIKKVMPRLVIAMILIQLSWPILTTAITAVNQISWGIESLVYLPFGGSDAVNINALLGKTEPGGRAKNGATKSDDGIDNTAFMTLIGGGLVWMVGFSAVGLLGLLIAVLMAIVVAFVTLAVRQVVIILLVLVAPLALVAWILPNTEKLWKMWWDMFIKALMMYPLILLLIAGGKIGAFVVIQSGLSDVVKIVMAIVLYFIPFFLLGKTMAMAGGAIGAVSGAISARGSKLTAMANKRGLAKQGQKWGERGQKAKTGDLFSGSKYIPGSNALANRANRLTRGIGAGAKFGSKRQAYYDSSSMGSAEDLMKDKNFTGIMYDDNAMRAMTYGSKAEAERELYKRALAKGSSDSEARKIASDAAAKASLVGFGGTRAVAAAQRLAHNKTGYDNAADAMGVINRVAGGNSSLQTSLRENIKFTSKGVGRHDLGALRDMTDEERNGGFEGAQLWNDSMTIAGGATADAASLGRDHTKSMDNFAEAVARQSNNAELGDAARSLASDLNQSADWANRGNKPQIANMGEIPSGQNYQESTQRVRKDPDAPGELIITRESRDTGREMSIGEASKRRTNSPDDPNAPTP